MKKTLAPLVLAFLAALPLAAAELGGPAPKLDISEWIKGQPVTLAEGKGTNIYVVEFWATWCPPCRTSIPHLTELQKKFKSKGVVIIGISDEKADVVKKFVEKQGDKMDYVVAIDGGKTSEGYMEAFGVNGIPHAFIVDKEGRIVWHGHPMSGLDEALAQVAAGTYDLEAARAKARKQAEAGKRQAEIQTKLNRYARLLMAGQDDDETKKLEAELVALDKEVGGLLDGEKFDPADFRKRVAFSQSARKYQELVAKDASAEELAAAEKALTTDAPEGFDLKEFKQMIAMQAEMQKAGSLLEDYLEAVGENGDAAKATELGKKVEALQLKSPELLNQIAWVILTEESVKQRDTKLALQLAQRAVDLSGGKNAAILDTYARALFDNGQKAEAIAQQKKALEFAEDDDTKAELKATLEKYEQAK
jgi:thiol-disulfide isomerase/thioredoxin